MSSNQIPGINHVRSTSPVTFTGDAVESEELVSITEGSTPEKGSSISLPNTPPRTPFSLTRAISATGRAFVNLFSAIALGSPNRASGRTTPNESLTTTTSIELSNSPSRNRSSSIDSQKSSNSTELSNSPSRNRAPSTDSQKSSSSSSSTKSDFKAAAKKFYSLGNLKSYVPIILTKEQEKNLSASQDQGGHGGTLKGPLEINGKTEQVFLKPFDGVEVKNYELIQEHAPDVAKFMPKVHGLATSNGKNFLIMENTRLGQDGGDLKQYGDIKIAGHIPGLDNLICDQAEMKATRGESKSLFDYAQMKSGATQSPGFMFYKDSFFWGKAGRILNFKNSESNLHEKLKTAKPTAATIGNLINDLRSLKDALEKSPIALIGGSIIIVKDEAGGLKPKLIDPAHVQYDPKLISSIEDTPHIYFGDEKTFENRKLSNIQGLNDLCNALENLKTALS